VAITRENIHGSPTTLPPWVFFTGADLGGRISCYNDNADLQSMIAGSEHVEAQLGRPVCVVSMRVYSTDMQTSNSFTKQPGLVRRKTSIALRLQIAAGSGRFLVWDYGAIMTHVINLLVLFRLPSAIIRFITLNMLGQLSVIYKKATIHSFDITEQCGAAAVRLTQCVSSFVQLADVQDANAAGKLVISKERLHAQLSQALQCVGDVLDSTELCQLSHYCYEMICGSSSTGLIGMQEYEQACLVNEEIDLKAMSKLFDVNRRHYPGEKLFTPTSLRRSLHIMESVESQSMETATINTKSSDVTLQMLAGELRAVKNELAEMQCKYELLQAQVKKIGTSQSGEQAEAAITTFDIPIQEFTDISQRSTDIASQGLSEQGSSPRPPAAFFRVIKEGIWSWQESLLRMRSSLAELSSKSSNPTQQTFTNATETALKHVYNLCDLQQAVFLELSAAHAKLVHVVALLELPCDNNKTATLWYV